MKYCKPVVVLPSFFWSQKFLSDIVQGEQNIKSPYISTDEWNASAAKGEEAKRQIKIPTPKDNRINHQNSHIYSKSCLKSRIL